MENINTSAGKPYRNRLPEGITLQVFRGSEIIFQSSGHWLHPLFEFEDFLILHGINDRSALTLHDSVDGRAAAFLTCRLGIKTVHSDTMSRLACSIFETYKVNYSCNTLVDRILCKTEELITDDMTCRQVYLMLCSRAGVKPKTSQTQL